MNSKSNAYLYAEIIKKVALTHPSYTAEQIVDCSAKKLYEGFISSKDRKLIQIAFHSNIKQKDLDKFLAEWDIEATSTERAAILAYTMKMHPELKFDSYTGPRLKGLLNYLRFQNLELISHFSKIVRKLNQIDIIPVIIKGGAIRYLRPDLPRVMGDIDILLHSQDELNTAKKIIQEMGYIYTDAGHSFDVHPKNDIEKGILDVHKFFSFLEKENIQFNKLLFNRAQKQKVFSVDAYLPSTEDMLFICLNNLALNLRKSSSTHGIPYAVFDLMYLIGSKDDFNWDIVAQDIFITHTEANS